MKLLAHWKKILPLFGIAVFIVLLWKVDIQKIWTITRQIDVRYLIALPFTVGCVLILQTVKWQYILIKQNMNVHFKQLFRITLISFFYATITPGKVGNLIKMAYLRDETASSLAECSSSVLVDKLLDAIVLFSFALAGAYILIENFNDLFVLITIAFFLLFIATLLFFNKALMKRSIKTLLGFALTEKMKAKFREPFDSFYQSMPSKRALVVPLLLALLTWCLLYFQTFIIALALGIHINFFLFIFLLSLGTVAGLLPITISGLGTRELVLVVVFLPYGIAPEKVVSMSLMAMLFFSYLPALISWLLTLRK